MAHTHEHDKTYFLEQLWTIATCGGLGIVMILLWYFGVLPIFLDSKFHDPVLWGGISLLVLVGIQIVSLWTSVSKRNDYHQGHEHEHDHSHVHEHDHDHDHTPDHVHGHEHSQAHNHSHTHTEEHIHVHENADDHVHDHGFAPWRYAVLILPIVLFLMKIPWPQPDEPVENNVIALKLSEAESAAANDETRAFWKEQQEKENKMVRVKGKFDPSKTSDRMFLFVRWKMTCCFADAYGEPVKVLVESPRSLDFSKLGKGWVKVIGKLDFRKMGDEYISIVKADSIKAIPTPANQFDN